VKRTFKLPLKITAVESLGVKSLDRDTRSKAEMRLAHYDFVDKQRKELQREKNNLESFIYETRDKLYNDDIIEASTEEERESLGVALSAASDWLDENSETATTAEYKVQSKILREKTDKIHFRIKEQRAFPKAVADLQRSINVNRESLQDITERLNVTEEERDTALLKIESISDWLQAKIVEQYALAKNVDPVVTSDEVSRKQNEAEFATKLLLRRPKKKKPVEVKLEEDTGKSDTEGEETKETTQETTENQNEGERKEERKEETEERKEETKDEAKEGTTEEGPKEKKQEKEKAKTEETKKTTKDTKAKAEKETTTEKEKKKTTSKESKKTEAKKTPTKEKSTKEKETKEKVKDEL